MTSNYDSKQNFLKDYLKKWKNIKNDQSKLSNYIAKNLYY